MSKEKDLVFEGGYFKDSKISNYRNYLERKFEQQAKDISTLIKKDDTILDFGAATGGLILVLKKMGYRVKGTDVSYWAVSFGRNYYGLKELEYFNVNLLTEPKDVLLFLDVLEHIGTKELHNILKLSTINPPRIMIVRVPVSAKEGENFVLEVSRNDKTHVQCRTKSWWIDLIESYGYKTKNFLNLSSIYDSEGVLAIILEYGEKEKKIDRK